MTITYKQKILAKTFGLLMISPLYVPAIIIYENRKEVYSFYKEVWQILTDTHPELKEEEHG